MLESKDLELQSRLTIGTLESNAEAIRKVVLKHLEDYTPENYIGRADEAKADKALLNKADKALNTKRLELEREYMEPFNKFKITISETCKAIKAASAGLDEIVKAEEERERGDFFVKPTAYWFINFEPTHGFTRQNDKEQKIIKKCKRGIKAGICSEERSMISPDYARNFICDFIIGKKQENQREPELF